MKIEYRELTVNNYVLRGFLTSDDNCKDLCVYLHGYTGHKNEHNFLFKQLSYRFLEVGVASLRFDYRGSGDSDGTFDEQNFDTVLEDACAMVKEGYKLNHNQKVIVLGFSMGGAAAGRMSVMMKDYIKKVVLISPAAMLARSLKNAFIYNPAIDDKYVDLGGYLLNVKFRETLKDLDMLEGCENFTDPVLIVQGSADQAVFPLDSFEFKKKYPNCEYRLVIGAPHGYSKIEYRKQLQEIILDFLRRK